MAFGQGPDAELFHRGPGFAFAVGAEEDDALGVGGGQQHAVRFLAAKHDLLKIVDNHDLAADQVLRLVVGPDAGHDLLFFFAHFNCKQDSLSALGCSRAARTVAMRRSSFAKSS